MSVGGGDWVEHAIVMWAIHIGGVCLGFKVKSSSFQDSIKRPSFKLQSVKLSSFNLPDFKLSSLKGFGFQTSSFRASTFKLQAYRALARAPLVAVAVGTADLMFY